MKTIEQLKRLVEARAKATGSAWYRDESSQFSRIASFGHDLAILSGGNNKDGNADFIALAGSLDLPALLAAWEVDRADIERLDKCHMNDLRTIIDLQQTLGEAQSRIAKLDAVVEAAMEVYPTLDRHADILASETLRRAAGILLNALSALEGGQHEND
jgi:hypothetical protein